MAIPSADLHSQLYGPGGTGLGPGYVAGPAADAPVFRTSVRVIDPLWILAGLVVVVLLWQQR